MSKIESTIHKAIPIILVAVLLSGTGVFAAVAQASNDVVYKGLISDFDYIDPQDGNPLFEIEIDYELIDHPKWAYRKEEKFKYDGIEATIIGTNGSLNYVNKPAESGWGFKYLNYSYTIFDVSGTQSIIYKDELQVNVFKAPYISKITPAWGPPGTKITLEGYGFENIKKYGGGVMFWDPDTNKKGDGTIDFLTYDYMTVYAPDIPSPWGVWVYAWTEEPVGEWWSGPLSNKVAFDISAEAPKTPPTTSRTWGTDSIGVEAPSTDWYLAEGCTATGFETWVLVQNPNDQAASVSLTYMTPDGAVPGPSETIPGNTRKSYNAADTVPGSWEVSTKVHSDQPVVVERSVYGNNRTWAHNSRGVSSPSTEWYLAEGSTGPGFETWVLVQNPNSTPANIHITYMTPSGLVDGPSESIAANARKTYDVSQAVPGGWEISTRITSDKDVVAERAMYGNNRAWATDSVGVSVPSTSWYLAEGCTAPEFETWVLVQNPDTKPANINITYMTPAGAKAGPSETIAANSRKSYDVSKSVPLEFSVSTKVESDVPVVVERSMYGRNRTWAHDSIGTSAPANVWYLAEGSTGPGFETWVLVQNPGDTQADVHLSYLTPSGSFDGPPVTLEPNSRTSINAAETMPGATDVSVVVASGKRIVVERAMYGDPK